MATNDIIAKLRRLLDDHRLTEEAYAVYLLVEVRKLLEQRNEEASYPFLKFYADWAVHAQKDRVTSAMRQVIAKVERAARYEVQQRHNDVVVQEPIRDFAFMRNLRGDLHKLLAGYGLDNTLTTDDAALAVLCGAPRGRPAGSAHSVTNKGR